jgi:hypothetical protein
VKRCSAKDPILTLQKHSQLTDPSVLSPMLPADPAVSFMLLLRGKIGSAKALAYMVAQVAGAVLGAFICTVLIPGVTAGSGLGAPGEGGGRRCCSLVC